MTRVAQKPASRGSQFWLQRMIEERPKFFVEQLSPSLGASDQLQQAVREAER